MKCKKVQKLILTGFTDNELDEALKEKVRDHIGKCPACQELGESLEKDVIVPLRQDERLMPREEVWESIKESIGEPIPLRSSFSIQEALDKLFAVRKPALAVISLLIILLAGGIFTTSYFIERGAMNVYMEDQLDFLESLTNGNGSSGEDNGMWTEDFFL